MQEHRIEVTEERAGSTLAALVREALGCPWSRARDLVRTGRVEVDGARVLEDASRPPPGAAVVIRPEARKLTPGVLDDDRVVHVDADVIVVRKPAATLTVPWDEKDKDTLVDQVRAWLARRERGRRRRKGKGRVRDPMVGVVQRLDKDTTGVLVFARNLKAKRALQDQLREHTVHRRYVAIVHGDLERPERFETELIRDRGDGLRGSWGVFRRPTERRPPRDAKRAVTHVRPREALRGATLVECRLETGRQHQIRIHLAEAGHPLVGEAVYVREHQGPVIDAPRIMLHAAELGFVHPGSGEDVRFRERIPEDFAEVRRALRKG